MALSVAQYSYQNATMSEHDAAAQGYQIDVVYHTQQIQELEASGADSETLEKAWNALGEAEVALDEALQEGQIEDLQADYGHYPICMAKTQYSFSTDPEAKGAPSGFTVPIREVRLSAGAGFLVAITGAIMTMPGLPKEPAALGIDRLGRVRDGDETD